MPFYQKRGIVPDKRHTQFRDRAGKLYSEELISRNGFSGIYSNLYHVYPPTGINRVGELEDMSLSKINNRHQPHHLLHKALQDADGGREEMAAREPVVSEVRP